MNIDSTWTKIIARWDGAKYVDEREEPIGGRQIFMRIAKHKDWQGDIEAVLVFDGGPTGAESYYVETLTDPEHGLKARGSDTLCICAGAVNSWPRCEVPVPPVIEFLEKNT
jgi:hypothetical protein